MKKKRIYQILILAALIIAVICLFIINKKIRITPIFAGGFEVRGVDVSHYQGTIDWEKLAGQDIDFAFIKATEGSSHVDECFEDNWQEAGKTDLYIGAYHFFSFDSDGGKQAELYIDTVGGLEGKMAPVVDVEFYGDKESNPPQKDEVAIELGKMLETLEEHYHIKPIIYTTYKAYHGYIKGEFDEYPLWIRNVYYQPVFTAGNKWTFWQYTDTAVLEGYQGTEKYIDMNVFRGTREELEELIVLGGGAESSLGEGGVADADSSLPDDAEEGIEKKIEKEFAAGHCNLVYDGGQIQAYSYLGMENALYVLAPESKTVIYPVRDFWVDQEQEAVWILEDKEELQIRKTDLRQDHFLEETLILDGNGTETLIADTYSLFMEEDQAAFWDLYAVLSGKEEEGRVSLGGTVSGVYKETNKEFEIVYEIDRKSGEIHTKGYLQDLGVHPLYQEFLFNNLTVDNSFAENKTTLGKKLSFFDDEIYLSEAGGFQKQFASADIDGNGEDEMLFRMKRTDGAEELIYVLAEESDRLICRDILGTGLTGNLAGFNNKEETDNFKNRMIKWFDCGSFLEIPIENCKDYKSRDEVFAAIEEGDFSVVARKDSDPGIMIEELEMAYGSDGDTRRTERCDIDGDGFDELLLLAKYEFEDYERIGFILDYRNGRAICTYLDWCDGNEWLLLGNEGKLIHCSSSNNGSCDYYGFKECALSARGIKDIDYTGYGIEVCSVYEPVESGLWWWEGQQPEITQRGIYFAEVRSKNAEEIEDTGTVSGWVKKLTSKEQFLEGYKELTGQDFVLRVDLERAGIVVADIRGGEFCLGYTDKDWFLRDFDFEGKEPFYQYFDENEELQLELYYNEESGKGCGIRYYLEDNRTPQGFYFDSSATDASDAEFLQERLNADPYELLARGGIDLSEDEWIEDYEENIEYISDGRPKHFVSHGWITYADEEHEQQKLLEIEFTYREDGTLKRRDYAHNTMALETWYSVAHSFYDTQERLLYENCYITHGSMDYYYIYQGEETMPSYCLSLDHDLGWIHAQMVAVHDVIEDETGKRYGIVRPDLSDNDFVKAVRASGNYKETQISHTYEDDYDGDGYVEAFVIVGDCMDMWGDAAENQISGDLWFVDHDNNAVYQERHTFYAWQEHIRQDGKTYLFMSHEIGLPWITDIYTVQNNEPVICAGERTERIKHLNESGQVVQTQDTYDSSYDIQAEFGWLGHTWKPYTFEFDHGKLKEIGAKEVALKDVVKIASLPDSFDEKDYDGVQYILRDNGELNINTASYDAEYGYIGFGYFTYYPAENGEWELTDEGPGIYRIQLDGDSQWDYLDGAF